MQTGAFDAQTPAQSLNRGQKIACLGRKLPNLVKRNDPNRGGQQELEHHAAQAERQRRQSFAAEALPVAIPSGSLILSNWPQLANQQYLDCCFKRRLVKIAHRDEQDRLGFAYGAMLFFSSSNRNDVTLLPSIL